MDNSCEKVPIHLKVTLTIREAAEYSNIGINKIDQLLRQPNCPFVLYVGAKRLVKRKEFEEYLNKMLTIYKSSQSAHCTLRKTAHCGII